MNTATPYRIIIRQDAVTDRWHVSTDLPTFAENARGELVDMMEGLHDGHALDAVGDAAHAMRAVAVNLGRVAVTITGCTCHGDHG